MHPHPTLPRLFARLALAACLLGAASAHADSALKTTTLRVGSHAIKVEIATGEGLFRGLMHRKSLGRDAGMLFIYDEPAYQSMWMKNTLIPLSVAFLDAGGTILNIADMQPQTLDPHMSAGPAKYAVEANLGWFAARGVKAGDKFSGLPAPR